MAATGGGGGVAIAAAVTVHRDEEKTPQAELSLPILLADRVVKSAQEAESNKQECAELAKQVNKLSHMLRSAVRLAAATQSLYDRPLRRIAIDVTKNLERALNLVRKYRHSGVLRQLFSINTTADFRKVSSLLESSIGDMRWLLSIFDSDGADLSMPPIASNDPILAWVWSFIATITMGQLRDRVEAANELASLVRDNDRNKKIIVEEGGIAPLLKLLKEGDSPEAQIAAANALFNIATDVERVRLIVDLLGVPTIVGVLGDSPMRVQIAAANLVARMAELDPLAQDDFVLENVTRPLVSLLSLDWVLDTPPIVESGKTSIHSIVQINKQLASKSGSNSHRNGSNLSAHSSFSDGSSRGSHYRKDKEIEPLEVQLQVKVSCAKALWKLSKGSVRSCRKITDTKGLLCLAKTIESESESVELQFNCLMTVMEITVVAELNDDLRRAAFRTNLPAAKAVLDQLLRVIREDHPALQIPAIKAIGCLARTFPARETRILGPLVSQLGNKDVDMATEAAIALGKFVCTENFNRSEHTKAIIEFDGVLPLIRLLRRANDRAQIHGLELLCYLALNSGNSKALEKSGALNAIEGVARSVLALRPDLRDLFAKAIHHLTLYRAVTHPHRQSYSP